MSVRDRSGPPHGVQDAIQDAFLLKKTPKVALDEAAQAANRLIGGRG